MYDKMDGCEGFTTKPYMIMKTLNAVVFDLHSI